MNIDVLVVGMVQTNCYIVTNESTKDIIIIDPGDEPEKVIEAVKEKGGNVRGILLTHGHFDHIYGVPDLRKEFHVKVYAGKEEEALLMNPAWNCSSMGRGDISIKADEYVKDKDELHLGSFHIQVIYTPGHTKGCVCYYLEEEAALFSGDTLFFESIGRTDLPTGNSHCIIESVKEKLLPLPQQTRVYPGHGASTSIAYEKKNNPYAAEDGYWE